MLTSIVHAMTAQLVPFLGSWGFPALKRLSKVSGCARNVRGAVQQGKCTRNTYWNGSTLRRAWAVRLSFGIKTRMHCF